MILSVLLWALIGSHCEGEFVPGTSTLEAAFSPLTLTSGGKIFELSNPDGFVTFNNVSYELSQYTSFSTDMNSYSSSYSESIENSYSELYTVYTSSYVFGGGVSVGDIGAAAKYNKVYYDAMNITETTGNSISISRAFWVQASLTLVPVFLIPKTTLFTMTFQSLSPNPSTSSEYLMWCETFTGLGPDYVYHVNLGGFYTINIEVSSRYVSTHTVSEVSEQTTIGAMYIIADMTAGADSDQYKSQLTEEFQESTTYYAYFTPASTSDNTSEQINSWKNQSYLHSAVTNMSTSSICDLLSTDSQLNNLETACRELRQYYITYGFCKNESYDDSKKISSKVESILPFKLRKRSDAFELPGLTTVGSTIDVTSYLLGYMAFNTSGSNTSTYCNTAHPTYCYEVPTQYYVTEKDSSLLSNTSLIFSETQDMVTSTWFSKSSGNDGFMGFGASSTSTVTTHTDSMMYQQTFELNLLFREFGFFSLHIMTFPPPSLSGTLLGVLDFVKNNGDESWSTVFGSGGGTHVIVSADLGGFVYAFEYFQKCVLDQESASYITTTTSKKYDPIGVFSSQTTNSHTTQTVDKKYESNSQSSFCLEGGTAEISPFYWDDWAPTVKDNPLPVHLTVAPLCLFVPSEMYEACSTHLNSYLKTSQDVRDASVLQMKANKPPPPSTCFEM